MGMGKFNRLGIGILFHATFCGVAFFEEQAERDRVPSRKRELRDTDLALRKALGEVIRELRKPNFNQDDFAAQVGVYRSHMGLIEQGKLDIRLTTLTDVAGTLGLSVSELLSKAEERATVVPAPHK